MLLCQRGQLLQPLLQQDGRHGQLAGGLRYAGQPPLGGAEAVAVVTTFLAQTAQQLAATPPRVFTCGNESINQNHKSSVVDLE